MVLRFLLVMALMGLGACATPRGPAPRAFCQSPDSPACRFVNAPVRLEPREVTLPGRAYPFHPIAARLDFLDATGRTWVAPPGTLTDGASIPPLFTDLMGLPDAREFRNAAAMHDAICGIGNEALRGFHSATWEETHRMFYEGLRVGGTDAVRAKIMFAAVYLGGPRWDEIRAPWEDGAGGRLSSQGGAPAPLTRGTEDWALGADVAEVALRAEMRRTRDWIAARNPTILQIEAHLAGRERAMIAAATALELGPEEVDEGYDEGVGEAEPEAPDGEDPGEEAGGDETGGDEAGGDEAGETPGNDPAEN